MTTLFGEVNLVFFPFNFLFWGSIDEILRQTANQVLHSNVPQGFEWIEEYQQYYSRESRYYYDPNSGLFYSPDSLTYYRFNEDSYNYEIVECCQPTKWASSSFKKRALHAVGEEEFKKFDQSSVDICELIFGIIGKVVKAEHLANPNATPLPKNKLLIKKDQITAEDIRRTLSKRKYAVCEENNVFDERSGEFVANRQQPIGIEEKIEDDTDSEEEVVDGDERAILMKEEGFDQPPCLRIMDKNRVLYIITICGGYIGSDPDCEIVLSNRLLPYRCAELSYSEDANCYNISKIEESCILQVNTTNIPFNKPIDICHGDSILISGERLDVHVHFGNNTCPSCEPGLYQEPKEQDIVGQAKYVSGEIARRKQLKKIMRSYGITPDASLNGPIVKKPAGPDLINIDRIPTSNSNPYTSCSAKPIPESQRRFELPPSSSAPKASVSKPLDSGNVGFKLLKSMGWSEGKGLGKEKQGNVEPVIAELKTNRQGLGADKTKPKTYKETILEKTKQRFNERR